ncbi:hypothetical protein HD553DRAFT_369084 [Filobasidium floriforme]|uniref:uncharacterized protein n=1 Tax=Filobasidium floriforme TaxID=5210 RepID=UPI001E8CCA8E|nr:uncharacterized protein HD553DRAFT_369084 [Filobasidium floriforme]KAH8086948.1 hypothetical protein HD553DRAFT_369084 [Filobasidium floriforme]
MGCFDCLDESGSEPEDVVVPRIHPQVGNPADAQAPLGRSDSEGNVPGTIPEQVEPVSTARGPLPPRVRVVRNENGGVQVIGDLEGGDLIWDPEQGRLRYTDNSGSHYVLGGDDRRRTQPAHGQSGRSRRNRRGSTALNRQRSSPGPDASTGANQEAESGQGDEESDEWSDAATLVEGDEIRGSRSPRRGPDGFSSGRSSRRPGTGFSRGWQSGDGSSVQSNTISSRGTWNQINSFSSGGTSNVQISSVMSGGIANQFNSPHQINYAGSGFQVNGVIVDYYGDPNSGPDLSNATVLNINGERNPGGRMPRR